jgi:serine-type D-Ala-D-Ala endopeptidase (penicillin-binding protein 7)
MTLKNMYDFFSNIVATGLVLTTSLFSYFQPAKTAVLGASLEKSIHAPVRLDIDVSDVDLTAKSVYAIDKKSGIVLYSKNSGQEMPQASITKLMTAMVFLDTKTPWDKTVVMQKEDHRNGNRIYLFEGEVTTVQTLFDLMLVASANEAAVALVRSSGKSNEEFVAAMNKKARLLGMRHSVFFDSSGLDVRNTSSAYDITLLAQASFSKEAVLNAVKKSELTYSVFNKEGVRKAENTSKLFAGFLNNVDLGYEIIGGKTGYLNEVGYNMTVEVAKNGHPIIVTIVGSLFKEDQTSDVESLSRWIFENYDWNVRS